MAKKYVLVVDDELDIVKVLAKRMELAGYEVAVATDGEAALALVRQRLPDLIILDIMLPKLNGYEVCGMLKQNAQYKHIPVIMFTGLSKEEDYWKGMNSGADAFLTKPTNFDALKQLVSRMIEALERDNQGPGPAGSPTGA